MRGRDRLLWCVTLVVFVTGCSGYGSHYPATGDPEDANPEGIARDLKEGDRVRVTLVDGTRVEGRIQSIDASRLMLESEDDDEEPGVIEAASILSIEKYSNRGTYTKAAIAVVLAVAIIVGFKAAGESDVMEVF